MSRKAEARATSRVGQIHRCAVCDADLAARTGDPYSPAIKKLTWMFEIPPESDTYVKLHGRPRTWFCKPCFDKTCGSDRVFAERNAHLELQAPSWWTNPASQAQRNYLAGLLPLRACPPELLDNIQNGVNTATKGQITQWLCLLETSAWKTVPAADGGSGP